MSQRANNLTRTGGVAGERGGFLLEPELLRFDCGSARMSSEKTPVPHAVDQ